MIGVPRKYGARFASRVISDTTRKFKLEANGVKSRTLEEYMMLEVMSRNWGGIALRGVLAILFGIVAFVWPGPTVAVLVIFLGAFALLEGITNVVIGVRGRQGLYILEGVISVIAGVIFLVWPGLGALTLLYLVAFWAILTGIVRIVAAVQMRRVVHNEWFLILSGVASVLFGAIAAVFPGAGILALLWFVAAWAIVIGVLLIALAISVRQVGHRTTASMA
jgi:uncharacterized membrane protein HdeD (DUF308 family)